MSTQGEFRLGKTEIRIEPELVSVRPHGGMMEEDLPQVLELMRRLREQRGQVFILMDMREGEKLPPAVRRMLAQAFTEAPMTAMGVYGASVEQHAAHALLMGALNAVSGHRPNVAYFPTEAEARKWLATERQRGGRRESSA